MPILTDTALKMILPKMYKVQQEFEAEEITNIKQAVDTEINRAEIKKIVKTGQRIALAVGSRGIYNLDAIVKQTIISLKELGADPFIIPAMGSHGGATSEGQKQVLEDYGITEEAMGVSIISSMEVEQIGETESGIPVFLDKNALQADLIVPIGRIKPHTDFKGPIESGICKMLAIGLGKHEGCSRIHQEGFDTFHKVIPEIAQVIINRAPIGFGIAIVENAFDRTAKIKCMIASNILKEEPLLLEFAKASMPKLLFDEIDVLIVEEIGKDISGAGMDPNITGRTTKGIIEGFTGPTIQRIVVLDLTEHTHGNAAGIGAAEFITKSVMDKIDLVSTYTNCVASSNPEGARLPIVMDTEREALIAAIKCCNRIDIENPKIVRIKNTLDLSEIYVSEALVENVKHSTRLKII
ncbi:lactate racemase domain-containing protein [Psychrobacillus sp. FSL K6-2836]|uniref:lactate racemase domain-containing protein n=1 Tax=Psychrobacillus sp. FSL K6-2836 TaxID=2921548 RepID=UPI0030FD1154